MPRAHVGVAGRYHTRTPDAIGIIAAALSARAATVAVTSAGSTAPVIRIRAPLANSISIAPRPVRPAAANLRQAIRDRRKAHFLPAARNLPPPAIQLARMNAGLAGNRRHAGAGLQRRRDQLLLLRTRSSAAAVEPT